MNTLHFELKSIDGHTIVYQLINESERGQYCSFYFLSIMQFDEITWRKYVKEFYVTWLSIIVLNIVDVSIIIIFVYKIYSFKKKYGYIQKYIEK